MQVGSPGSSWEKQMNTGSASSLVLRDDSSRFDVQIALGGFLAGYSSNTFLAYQQDLRQFVSWCANQDLELFTVKRTHIELFARWLEHRGAARATIGLGPRLARFAARDSTLDSTLIRRSAPATSAPIPIPAQIVAQGTPPRSSIQNPRTTNDSTPSQAGRRIQPGMMK